MPLNRSLFRDVRLHANNRHYGFLIHVAKLILESAIPDEKPGSYQFRDFSRDRQEMAQLFEAFVFNFLQSQRRDLKVGRDQLRWDARSVDDPALDYLPTMRTDVSVRAPGRTVIIDAKYYEQTLQEHYDRRSVHSGNLYQLVSYLRNLEPRGGQDAVAEGMLIYPVTADPLDLTYEIQGHRVRIYTLDLNNDWRLIENHMRALI
jgi:5-methylcytosine-specific restriction enzyme subunit McrC